MGKKNVLLFSAFVFVFALCGVVRISSQVEG